MRHIVPLVWETVAAASTTGHPPDRDALCRKFAALRPDLDAKLIETIVAEALRFHGSGDRRDGT